MTEVGSSQPNPVVFLDFASNKQKIGRACFELFTDLCPKAAENFRQFCTGEYLWKGKPAGYKDTCLHKIVEDKFLEGGDFVTDGVNCKPRISIWGQDALFEDESYELKHNEAGLLSMVNLGSKHGNGNLFRVTAGPCPELDGKAVVFGRVTDEHSLKVIKKVAALPVGQDYRPKYPVIVKECG